MWLKKVILPVEVSARHIHLCKKDLAALFGAGYELKEAKKLSQPGEFAGQETVTVKNGDRELKNVRIVGPLREKTQVEISRTDAFALGANPPLRLSGDLEDSASVALEGPAGSVGLGEGLIIARRHIHCATDEAKKAGLRDGQLVSVEIKGDRPVTFHCVEVRVKDRYKLSMHLDTDEANAAGISGMGQGTITFFKAKKQ